MAGGVKITGARGKGPTGHGSKNQKHRAKEGERASTSMPRNRPEGKAGAADTMAGGREHSGARETGTRHHETQIKRLGEVKGIMGSLTAGKDGDGDGWPCGGEDGGRRSFSVRRLRPRARAKLERGSRGAREGARLLFIEAEERRGTLPRRQSWAAVAAAPGAGGCRAARGRRRRRQVGPGLAATGRAGGVGGWRPSGPAGLAGPNGRGARPGWHGCGAGLRCWAAGKEMAMGPKVQEERERGIFPFLFPNKFSKSILNTNFN